MKNNFENAEKIQKNTLKKNNICKTKIASHKNFSLIFFSESK